MLPASLSSLALINVRSEGGVDLGALIAQLPATLTELGLGHNALKSRDDDVLEHGFPAALSKVILTYAQFDEASVKVFAHALTSSSIKELDLARSVLAPAVQPLLFSSLPVTLVELDLGHTLLTDDALITLANNPPANLEFGISGTRLLADHMPPALEMLILDASHIDDVALEVLLPSLPTSLLHLGLAHSGNITDVGAAILAAELPPNLTSLDLYRSSIWDEGRAALRAAAPPSLKHHIRFF
ncbi:hypothetical protein H9P43_007928 [Blastocladiella emersonii ATCC 22665]|nr:hypothetical protein H9P43_007928 [Blastocladiella emersonii ATCC 22665]